jgi:uncharacterized protein YoxC
LLNLLLERINHMSAALDSLNTSVTGLEAAVTSATAQLDVLAKEIAVAASASDPAVLAVAQQLGTLADNLNAAVAASKPA